MKLKQIFTLIVVTFNLSLFNSCNSDDDNAAVIVVKNEINVGTKNFEIGNAFIIENSTSTFNGITNFEVYFTSADLSLDSNDEFTGSGDLFSVTVFSDQSTAITAGDYMFNNQNNTAFLVNRGTHFFDYESALGDNQTGDLDVESGSIYVALENNQYTITFNLVDELGESITGFYKGEITGLN